MTSALPYVLALLGLLIVVIALDFMRSAGFTHPEMKTAGAAVFATGVLLVHVVNAASSGKR